MSTPILRTSPPPELSTPGLVLLWGNSPNGWKITYALQALKESGQIQGYTAVQVYLQKDEQFQDWFVELNPNSESSAIVPSLIVHAGGEKWCRRRGLTSFFFVSFARFLHE